MDKTRFAQIHSTTPYIHQDMREFWWLIEKVQTVQHDNILEIGSAHGGTLLFWQELGNNVVSLDKGPLHGAIPMERFFKVKFIIGDSHEEETLEQVREIIPSVDVLFIDGDH